MRQVRVVVALAVAAVAAPAGASSWFHLDPGVSVSFEGIHFPVDATTGWAVGALGTIVKTTDGGATWTAQDSGIDTVNLKSVYFPVDEQTGFVVGTIGTALRTTDGGANWTAMTPGTTENLREVVFPVDALTGYIVGDNGTILKTTNGGDNWSPQTSGTTMDLLAVDMLDASTGYAGGWWGTILKTTDGGANWNSQTSGTTNPINDLDFPVDATTGYAASSSGVVLKTTDGGSNWDPESVPTVTTMYAIEFPVDADTGWLGGFAGQVYHHADGVWSAQSSGTGERIYDFDFPTDEVVGYAVGWNGVILKTIDAGGTLTSLHPEAVGSVNTFSGSTGCAAGDWDCLNDQAGNATSGTPETHDGTTSYLHDAKDNGGRVMMALANGIVPPGAIVTAITLTAEVGKGSGGPAPTARLSYERLGIDAGPVDGPSESVSASGIGQTITATWSCLSWSGVDVDALEIGMLHVSGTQLNVSQIVASVTWEIQGTVYRSIGTETLALYVVGDVTVTEGDRKATFGGGADLPVDIGPGDQLTVNTENYHIAFRVSNTEVVLQETPCTDATDASYSIFRAYNTMQAWEDDRDGDLVTDGRQEIGVVYNDGAFSGRLTIDGSTTDADHTLTLTVPEAFRHTGFKNTGAVINAGGGWGGLDAITINDGHVVVEHLEIRSITDAGSAIHIGTDGDDVTIDGVFVHTCQQASNAGIDIQGDNVTVTNSILTGGTTYGIRVLDNASASIYNCTIVGDGTFGTGVADAMGTTVSIRNTISVDHPGSNDFVLWSSIGSFDHNMYSGVTGFSPSSYGGANQAPPGSLESLFVSHSGEDFHLETSGHNAGDTGVDLSSIFTQDIDGKTRSGLWEIGADDAGSFAGGGGSPPKITRWTEVAPQ